MRGGLALSVALLASSLSSSQNPFDEYIAQVKSHQLSSVAKDFAKRCGLQLRGVSPQYAVTATGTWKSSNDLPKDVYDLEADSFDTAEMWTDKDGAKVLDWWDVDLEQDINTLLCLDQNGRVRFLEATNWSFHEEDSSVIDWIYKQRRDFDSHGTLTSKQGHFEDISGKVIHPNLSADEATSFDWVPQGYSLNDFGMGSIWQKHNRPVDTND